MRLLLATTFLLAAAGAFLAWRWHGERDQAVEQRIQLRATAFRRLAKAGEVEQNPADSLWYVHVHAGRFQMGCSANDSACDPDEQPSHEVAITSAFWMGQTEVTQAAYERVMKSNPSVFRVPDLPAENMLWEQAVQYCAAVGISSRPY